MKSNLFSALFLTFSCTSFAAPSLITDTLLPPHTSRTILVKHADQTNWRFEFTPLTEQTLVEFTDPVGNLLPINTLIPIDNKFSYGFSFQTDADFDIIYAVTAISFDHEAIDAGNPKCVFLFSGLKPGIPEIYVNNFAGAKCQFERDNKGSLNLFLDK